ncbi:hypothetical protein [Microbispora sp. H13382]|uniref:hypothetical protein n=1 Tax=Microbispora sp. H13382 TaxID=2729112 RepID=UPI001601FAE2|nr:hypothetical protein [Microbispora sp. H13382]
MTPRLVHYGPVTCLNVTGMGEPGDAEHASAIGALHAVASVMGGPAGPLEGRWWVEGMFRPPLEVPRDQWRWHLLVPLPDVPEAGWSRRHVSGRVCTDPRPKTMLRQPVARPAG